MVGGGFGDALGLRPRDIGDLSSRDRPDRAPRSLMIMPVQRIPRYELLLRELQKTKAKLGEKSLGDPDWMDELEQVCGVMTFFLFDCAQTSGCVEVTAAQRQPRVTNEATVVRGAASDGACQCMEAIHEVAAHNNEQIRITESKAEMYVLQQRFAERLDPPLVGPGVPIRQRIREGAMRKVRCAVMVM